MEKQIEILCPPYRGAAYPAFNVKAINESRFDDDDRFKEAHAWVNDEEHEAHIRWIAQISETPSESFIEEVIRAVKANVTAPVVLTIEFCSRDNYGDFDVNTIYVE